MAYSSSISNKYASLLSNNFQENLAQIQSRKTSAFSTVSTSSTASEFLDQKIRDMETDIDFTQVYRDGLVETFDTKLLGSEELTKALEEVNGDDKKRRKEWVTLKRQRRHTEEDILDQGKENVETAYGIAIRNWFQIPSQLSNSERNRKNHAQQDFRKGVEDYYHVAKEIQEQTKVVREVYCCVSKGWYEPSSMKAAHIVPKILQSDELSYLFGVGEMNLSDPRNGLMMHRNLEEALDRAEIVIVPIPSSPTQPTEWKLLLTREIMRHDTALGAGSSRMSWDELDGTVLKFLNENRPARRYLYFKHLTTYMTTKQREGASWADKSEQRGVIWASPGPYLRSSFLRVLSRQVTEFYWPEALYAGGTFDADVEAPTRTVDQKKVLATSLNLKIDDARESADKRTRGDYQNEDDSEEDDGDGGL